MKYVESSDVFIVNFEHISHLVLVFLLLVLHSQFKYSWSTKPFILPSQEN